MKLLLILFCCLIALGTSVIGQQTNQEWQLAAIKKYPDLGVSDSEFNKRFLDAYAKRKTSDPSFFTNAQWPMMLADEIADPHSEAPPKSSSAVLAIVLVIAGIVFAQCVVIWIASKLIGAPNSGFGDALKLAAAGSLNTAIAYGGYFGIENYYQPQPIPSAWWLIIFVGFCAWIIASFRLTMNILGIGFLRAILVGLISNVLWKALDAFLNK